MGQKVAKWRGIWLVSLIVYISTSFELWVTLSLRVVADRLSEFRRNF